MGRLRRTRENEATGSDAFYDNQVASEFTGTMYKGAVGHPVPVQSTATPFYGTNAARYNGADLEPIPITPVRGQNWPGMQIQMKTGWGSLSFGKKLTYDDYLRLLTDSATKNRSYLLPSPSSLGLAAQRPGPAPGNVQQMINSSAGSQPNAPGGPGMVAANVNLRGRRYYG